ncbi:MAG: dienelactone hydrolase family protein [Tepidisphaeraceae bacterium]
MRIIAAMLLVMSAISSAGAAIKSQTVEYKCGDATLKGYLAYDDAVQGKRPGVLVVHEWWGQTDYARHRAEMLAQLGYTALAVDMFGDGKTTDDPKQAAEWAGALYSNPTLALERFAAAYDFLKDQPTVDPQKMGAIGYCFGGAIALTAARAGVDLDCVVSFHGSLGAPANMPVKPIAARILVCNGADDKFVSAEEIAAFKQEMTQAGADFNVINYPGAVHSFTNPEADRRNMDNVKYDAAADKASWQAMIDFFKAAFGK